MKSVKGNVVANYLGSPAEYVGNTTMKEADEFQTILLSDVFEAVYVTSRFQHESEPLVVLVTNDTSFSVEQQLGHHFGIFFAILAYWCHLVTVLKFYL